MVVSARPSQDRTAQDFDSFLANLADKARRSCLIARPRIVVVRGSAF